MERDAKSADDVQIRPVLALLGRHVPKRWLAHEVVVAILCRNLECGHTILGPCVQIGAKILEQAQDGQPSGLRGAVQCGAALLVRPVDVCPSSDETPHLPLIALCGTVAQPPLKDRLPGEAVVDTRERDPCDA